MRARPKITLSFAPCRCLLNSIVGTSGPEPPPLQGQGRWPLPRIASSCGQRSSRGRGGRQGLRYWRICERVCRSAAQRIIRSSDEQLAWSAPMLRGLNHVGAVGINGKVYCLGGFVEQNHFAVSDVRVYDPVIDKWRQLMPLALAAGFSFSRCSGGKDSGGWWSRSRHSSCLRSSNE